MPDPSDYVSFAGLIFTSISTLCDLRSAHTDLTSWKEEDLIVDGDFLDLALKDDLLPAGDYGWVREEQAASYELRKTHEVVIAANAETRVRRRILCGRAATGRDILMRKFTQARSDPE